MSRRTQRNVGVIGLGIIGSRVREVLRKKGFHVFVWNRTPRPIPNFVGAPAELAEMCDYLQIFVSDDDALLDVIKLLSPGLGPRHIVMAHSTVSPHSILAAAEIVTRRGARFLEAPFTGSKEAAENGQLVYYLGGDETAMEEARPILQASSKEVMAIGEIGQATAIKITTNMVTAATVQAAAEALALLQAAGLPLDKFVAAMKGNASNSKTLDLKLPKMVEGNFDPHFSVKHMLKDMQIASRLGLSHHLELGVTSAARDRLLEQMQRGHGDEDYAAVARKYFSDLPNSQPEADLELFEPRIAIAPIVDVDLATKSASAEIAPEADEPTRVADVDLSRTVAETEPEPEPAEPLPEEAAEPETAPATSTQTIPENLPEESEHRRRFFGRLLGRESNS